MGNVQSQVNKATLANGEKKDKIVDKQKRDKIVPRKNPDKIVEITNEAYNNISSFRLREILTFKDEQINELRDEIRRLRNRKDQKK